MSDMTRPNAGRGHHASKERRDRRSFLGNGSEGSAFVTRWEERKRAMSANRTHNQRNAERWHRLEAEARLIALTMADADRQRVMLLIADGYKLLARRAELRETSET
jgi:hypothetical protein